MSKISNRLLLNHPVETVAVRERIKAMSKSTDLYTKIVLTIIAAALLVIALDPFLVHKNRDINIAQIAGGDLRTDMFGGERFRTPFLPVSEVR